MLRFDIAVSRIERKTAREDIASGGRSNAEASKADRSDREPPPSVLPAATARRTEPLRKVSA